MTNLNGLNNLSTISGTFFIIDACRIKNLNGLSSLSYIGSSFFISSNDSLETFTGLNTLTQIENGCNSPDEVQDSCETVNIQECDFDGNFMIYPNPTNDYLFIENPSNYNIIGITIYNTIGQIVYLQTNVESKISIADFNQGIYVLELSTNKYKTRKKFVVRN